MIINWYLNSLSLIITMRLVTTVMICYLLYHSCLHFDIIIKPSSLCVHNVINIYLSGHQYHILLYQYYIHIYPELVLVTLISGSKQDIVYNIQELNIYIHTYISLQNNCPLIMRVCRFSSFQATNNVKLTYK